MSLNTTDVKMAITDSPDAVVAGKELVYTLTVTNNGPNPASDVQVVDTLPVGVSYQINDAGCVEHRLGTLTCDLGVLLALETREIMITVLIDLELVAIGSSSIVITNEARVDNLAGPEFLSVAPNGIWPDSDPSNNSAAEETLVLRP